MNHLLIASIQHDLRTLLNVIIGFSEMLLEDMEGRGMGFDALRNILSTGKQILELIEQRLDPEKIKDGNEELSVVERDLHQALRPPLHTVLGFCDMLIKEAELSRLSSVLLDLENIRTAARRFLAICDRSVDSDPRDIDHGIPVQENPTTREILLGEVDLNQAEGE